MSRRNAKHPLQKSTFRPKSRRPRQKRASNKRQKKRILQGEATRSAKRSHKQRDTTKKRRTVERPIPAMSSLVDSFSEVTDPHCEVTGNQFAELLTAKNVWC